MPHPRMLVHLQKMCVHHLPLQMRASHLQEMRVRPHHLNSSLCPDALLACGACDPSVSQAKPVEKRSEQWSQSPEMSQSMR